MRLKPGDKIWIVETLGVAPFVVIDLTEYGNRPVEEILAAYREMDYYITEAEVTRATEVPRDAHGRAKP